MKPSAQGQKARTRANVARRRARHAKNHPNDCKHDKRVPVRVIHNRQRVRRGDDGEMMFVTKPVLGSLDLAKRWL